MSNFATLNIQVNYTGVNNATGALNQLGQAAANAQGATQNLTGATVQNTNATNQNTNATNQNALAHQQLGQHANTSAAGVRNVRNAMVQATIQMQDFGIQVASGGNPLLAFVQQFSQLQQMSAVTGVTLRQIGANFLQMLTPINVAGGALITFALAAAKAAYDFSESQLRMERAVSGLGRGMGTSVETINRVAQEQAAAARLSTSATRDLLASFVAVGNVDITRFNNLATTVRNFAATIGQSVPEASHTFAQALQNPARGADLLNERLGGLDFRTRELIRTLQASGREQQAQQVLYNAFAPQMRQAAELTNIFGRAWQFVATQAGAAADAIGRALMGPQTTQERYVAATRRAAEAAAEPQFRDPAAREAFERRRAQESPEDRRIREERINQLGQEAEHLGEIYRREVQAREAEHRRIREAVYSQQTGEAARTINDPRAEQLRQLREYQSLLVQAQNNPAIVERAGGIMAINDAYRTVTRQIQNMTDANGNLVPAVDRVRQAQEIARQEIEENYSPAQQRNIAIIRERQRLLEQGVAPEVAEAQAVAAGDQAHRRATEGLRENSLERQLAARQAEQTIRTETDMIGRSAGEQARIRFELQARQTLEQEARRNRLTPAEQEAEVRYMRERGQAIEQVTQAQARQNVVAQASIDRRLLLMSDSEASIARTLQPVYGRDFETALRSSEAAMLRWNNTLKTIRDAGGEFFSSLAKDLAEGVKPLDAFNNALKRMATTLLDMSVRSLWQQAFGMAMGGNAGAAGGGFFASIGSFFKSIFGGAGGAAASASGNAFSNGQIIDTPTFHGMKGGGVGIAGEIGTEAILPLQRNSQGQLGVVADVAGGGAGMIYAPQVNFAPQLNIAMPQGADEDDGRRFGEAAMREMRGAFRSMLATEMRPGGMLRQA